MSIDTDESPVELCRQLGRMSAQYAYDQWRHCGVPPVFLEQLRDAIEAQFNGFGAKYDMPPEDVENLKRVVAEAFGEHLKELWDLPVGRA